MDPKDVHALRPGLTELDPVTLAVIQNGLQQVCNEMDLAFVRAAFSPVISEALDRSDGIYHRDSGELIAQAVAPKPDFAVRQGIRCDHLRINARNRDPSLAPRRVLGQDQLLQGV